jgi:hypothetical protein
MERTAQVDVDDGLEILVRHLFQRCAAHDSGVVDEDVDPAVTLEGRVDDRLASVGRGDRVGAGDGFASGVDDFAHYVVGGCGVGAVTGEAATGVVHDDLRPARREQQGVGAAEPPATPGHDGGATVESQVRHAPKVRL